jgi:hypothetical protein
LGSKILNKIFEKNQLIENNNFELNKISTFIDDAVLKKNDTLFFFENEKNKIIKKIEDLNLEQNCLKKNLISIENEILNLQLQKKDIELKIFENNIKNLNLQNNNDENNESNNNKNKNFHLLQHQYDAEVEKDLKNVLKNLEIIDIFFTSNDFFTQNQIVNKSHIENNNKKNLQKDAVDENKLKNLELLKNIFCSYFATEKQCFEFLILRIKKTKEIILNKNVELQVFKNLAMKVFYFFYFLFFITDFLLSLVKIYF